nr:substrate binding domain-containing protein [Lysobacter antibioticus]
MLGNSRIDRDGERLRYGIQQGGSGGIRVLLPRTFSVKIAAPLLAEFAKIYPELKVEVQVDDREACLEGGGFDIAVRVGHLADSTLIARSIGHNRMWVCASPAYLALRSAPDSPKQFELHDCLLHSGAGAVGGWTMQHNGHAHLFRTHERIRSACYFQLLEAAKAGLGLAYLPGYLIQDAVLAGDLKVLLADAAPPPQPISLVYPASRKMSPKVMALVTFLAQRIPSSPDLVSFSP